MTERPPYNVIPVLNMTGFFNRELFMYSLGDIKFKKPVSLKKVAYLTAFLIVWILPNFAIFGLHMNVWFLAYLIVPPIIMGNAASKPMWGGGRGLFDFLKVLTNYLKLPKGWTDHREDNDLEEIEYHIESEIWISRRRETVALIKQEQPDIFEAIRTPQKPGQSKPNNKGKTAKKREKPARQKQPKTNAKR